MTKIGIVGCGWLGKPLATSLSLQHKVECFSREQTPDNSSFWNNDIIIISINTKDNYLHTLSKIATLTKPSASIILMSSTSVYREFDEEVNEKSIITKIALQKEAELLVQSLRKKVLILRLGGLMGEDRVAGKWKKVSTFTDGPVNYIHQDDVIGIVNFLIDTKIEEGLYNLVAPKHPLRSEVHAKNCKEFNWPIGTFEGKTARVVSSNLPKDYSFLHPNPLHFWA